MLMMRRWTAVAGAVVMATSVAHAQADSSAAHGVWGTVSLGAAGTHNLIYDGVPVAALEIALQRGPWLASARQQFMGTLGPFDGRAFSLSAGRATQSRGVGFASASLGVAALEAQDCIGGCGLFGDSPRTLGPEKWAVGLVATGDAALRVGHPGGAGIGLTGYVNVNALHSYAGVGLELLIGRWR